MKHMGNDERNRIEFMLGCGRNITDIAKALGRSQSTISRELLNRRIESEKHYACSNRICVHFDECSLKHFSSSSDRGLRKNIKGCFEGCPNFREAVCERLNRAPYVCNGCEKAHNCPMKKRYYVASGAQANYRGTLVNSRIGVHPDAETIEKMDKLLSPSVRNGQSVDAIIANNPELFAKYARSTIYGWIEDGLFSSKKHNLPFAGTRRKPHKRPEIKTNAKCRVGRTYEDMTEWLKEHPHVIPTEADTQILKDKSYYRVMNVTAFGSATPSYFHHSLGGYHAAKLTRFNDLQAKMIDVEKNELIAAIKSDDFNIDSISTPALNMMNTKYFMFGDRFVLENPHALGAAWFVDKIDYVKGADAEMAILKSINPAVEAVADESYRKILGSAKSKSAGDTIYLTSYKPNELQYKAVSNAGNVAVFSEVFFPWGWYAYIDGKPAEIGRVDYTLRAMAIPSGSHDIVMRFDPKSIHTTEIVAYTSILIIYFAVALAIIAFLMNYYKKDE